MLNVRAQIIFLLFSVKNNCYNQKDAHFLRFTQEILFEFVQGTCTVHQMLQVLLSCKVKIRENKNHSTRIVT